MPWERQSLAMAKPTPEAPPDIRAVAPERKKDDILSMAYVLGGVGWMSTG